MDGLNSIDDDLTDFINQIANSNDSDSPPGSAQSSSDSNSVRQLELLETIETKAVLPPCQVCGGNSSGYHYGANTCEACKVFFRRSEHRHQQYTCRNGRKRCTPANDYTFLCRFCRYSKCLSVGMSKGAIKIGPYSRERRLENMKQLAELRQIKFHIPKLPIYSDADDLLVLCSVAFNHMKNIQWASEIDNFHTGFNIALQAQDARLSNHDYMDILEVTGVEADERKHISFLIENFFKVALKKVFPFARQLPGMMNLGESEILFNILSSINIVHLTLTSLGVYSWQGDRFFLNLQDHRLGMDRNQIVQVSNEEIADFQTEYHKRFLNLQLTWEETMLILAIHLVSSQKKSKESITAYNRLVLAFTRYMQGTYGNSFVIRFQSIINFLAYFKQFDGLVKKFYDQNKKYLNYVFPGLLLKFLYNMGQVEESKSLLEDIQRHAFQ